MQKQKVRAGKASPVGLSDGKKKSGTLHVLQRLNQENHTTFGELCVGERFQFVRTESSPSGECPIFFKTGKGSWSGNQEDPKDEVEDIFSYIPSIIPVIRIK